MDVELGQMVVLYMALVGAVCLTALFGVYIWLVIANWKDMRKMREGE